MSTGKLRRPSRRECEKTEDDPLTGQAQGRSWMWYLMFYIGFFDLHRAQIGIARSRDGISGWERHPANSVISPGLDQWDHDACYKPSRSSYRRSGPPQPSSATPRARFRTRDTNASGTDRVGRLRRRSP